MAITLQIVNGDVIISSMTGRANTITGHDLAKQYIAENLSLNAQSDGTGADLNSLVGTVPYDDSVMQLMIYERITLSFRAWRTLQNQAPSGLYSPSELVSDVRFVTVSRSASDPTAYVYYANIQTDAGRLLKAQGLL